MATIILDVTKDKGQDSSSNKYTLKYTAYSSQNIEKEVFAFERNLDGVDGFLAVCTTVLMTKLAANSPIGNLGQFRKNVVELDFSTLSDRDDTESLIDKDLDDLVKDWQELYPDIVSTENIEIKYPES